MQNKRGQFYIIGAILIVIAISGIAGINTYAIYKSNPRTITDLGSELREESLHIVEHGIYNGKNLKDLIENFTDQKYSHYFLQKTQGTDIVFVYGNKKDLYAAQYKMQSTGTVSATIGGSINWETVGSFSEITKIDTTTLPGNKLKVKLLEKQFTFELKDNEMFYFVIAKDENGERYIERN
ncbi:hypothetical protein GOV14_05565 [Candidatus Pacearchaeota archaeon]|nr:hypothetical protein [Candidatus Pacearchaeota archaeon]